MKVCGKVVARNELAQFIKFYDRALTRHIVHVADTAKDAFTKHHAIVSR